MVIIYIIFSKNFRRLEKENWQDILLIFHIGTFRNKYFIHKCSRYKLSYHGGKRGEIKIIINYNLYPTNLFAKLSPTSFTKPRSFFQHPRHQIRVRIFLPTDQVSLSLSLVRREETIHQGFDRANES